jgi:serine/threonine-protein kinase
MLAPGTRVADRYVVEGHLGGGGMADVYAAEDLRLGAPVAVKVLRVPAQAIAERLELEGRIQARLRHPNVVAVTDRVTVAGAPGLVMERVDGRSLAGCSRCTGQRRTRPCASRTGSSPGCAPPTRPASCTGTSSLPTCCWRDALVPRVADFGLARLLGSEGQGTRTGVAMGTPR